MTHVTSQMHSDASQAIPTLSSAYVLKSWQLLLICDDFYSLAMTSNHWRWLLLNDNNGMHLMPMTLPQKSLRLSLYSSASKPRDLSLSSMQPSIPCSFLLICSILIPDHYLRSFPSHCLAHCLSIARYSFMYLIYVAYARFLLSHYIYVSLVVIPQPITPVLPII
jgi:hypothetical protein